MPQSNHRSADTRYAHLIEHVQDAVVEFEFVSREPVVRSVNESFVEIFGYGRDTIRGESLNDWIVPERLRDEASYIDAQTVAGERTSREVTRLTADGPRDFLHRSVPYDNTEQIDGIALYTDITERRQRERELQETKQQLKQSNAQLRRQNDRLDTFASVISHDLRNPLGVAKLQAQLAADGDETAFEPLNQSLSQMDSMIDDLMVLLKAETGLEETEPVTLSQHARQAWELIEHTGSELVVDLPWGYELSAHPCLLEHILQNLFRNAVEHNSIPVTVTVGATGEEETSRGFYVADDGDGIPPQQRETVFEHGHTTTDDGCGLGLWIVAEFAAAHGWEVGISDSSSGGTRFEFLTD